MMLRKISYQVNKWEGRQILASFLPSLHPITVA